jgi:hypothetical protein
VKQNPIKNNAMFKIDLLKGLGIPPRSGPVGLTIILITFIVPVFAAILLYGLYHNSRIMTRIKQQDVLNLEADIAELSDALKIKKNLEREKIFYNTCISEVNSSVRKYSQWSPVLSLLLDEMPSSVVLEALEVEKKNVQKKVPVGKSNKLKIIDLPLTKLILQVGNREKGDYGEQIKDFRNRLYDSPAFGSKLEDIIFSRQAKQDDGVETISYKIECMFKTEL